MGVMVQPRGFLFALPRITCPGESERSHCRDIQAFYREALAFPTLLGVESRPPDHTAVGGLPWNWISQLQFSLRINALQSPSSLQPLETRKENHPAKPLQNF